MKKEKRPRQQRNKGISVWNIGFNKWRVSIATGDKKSRTIGYFYDFKEAVFAYLKAHLETYGILPVCKYIEPGTNRIVFDGTKGTGI